MAASGLADASSRATSACGMPVHARKDAATSGVVAGMRQLIVPPAAVSVGIYSVGGDTMMGLAVRRPHGPGVPAVSEAAGREAGGGDGAAPPRL